MLQSKEVFMLWAEAQDGANLSPSLLLAQTLLLVRKESAMFLRMSTGFGYAQIGDYMASLFYLFRCATAGMKQKLKQFRVSQKRKQRECKSMS